jgi:trehalose 6-phosphate synthase
LKFILRLGGVALVIASVGIVAALPLVTSFVKQWSRQDVEMRSRLVFRSVRDQVVALLAVGEDRSLADLFERIASDERVLAIGYCEANGELRFASQLMPPTFSCVKAARAETETFAALSTDQRQLLVSTFPITADGKSGHLVVLHDLSFADERGAQARAYLILVLAGCALGGAAIASIVVVIVLRHWTGSIRKAIDDMRAGRAQGSGTEAFLPKLGQEVRDALAELDQARQSVDAAHVQWTPETLHKALANELPGSEVIIVSNREPYIHNRAENDITLLTPASGLVAALEPVAQVFGATWVAHGSGSADRETVDAHDRIAVPPETPTYTLRRVWLSEEENDGYYFGFANEGLWPLSHIAFERPTFRENDWRMYRSVNQKFADAVSAEARRADPIVLVQDYHFALLPRLIRQSLPEATVVTFWHVPWPNSEAFGICPYKEEIVDGLLGSSILGFHTQFHCNNFMDTVDRFIESRIDRERHAILSGGNETLVRPYPISIEWPPAALAGQRPVNECRSAIRSRFGFADDVHIGVGVERFDYTKGILDRIRAIDSFLTRHPEWKGRFVFLQVAAPTRSKLSAYRRLEEDAVSLAEEVNARHQTGNLHPIILLKRHHQPQEIFELFRAADLCVVSSLHDGMNLVAKEFVAARDDELGVLILSLFAGAARELNEALIVNPYDEHGVGEAIGRALKMSENEQRERMRLMRDQIRTRNVYRWAGQMLLDAAQLRKRQRIRRLVTDGTGNLR